MYGSNAYRNTGIDSGHEISPQRKVAMLLAGTIERIHQARRQLDEGDLGGKAQALSSAISIVEVLRLSLDAEAGGELAERLGALYDYLMVRMAEANASNDQARLDEVLRLLDTIASAWREGPEAIPAEAAAGG